MYNGLTLVELHKVLGHPEITRLSHFIKTKNLSFSVKEVKRVCSNCQICAEMKLHFLRNPVETLVETMHPLERLIVNFKGLLPGSNKYVLFVVDEFNRFPFAFPSKNMSSTTVILCLSTLFNIFGLPIYVHSDRGSSFISRKLKQYLND